MAGARRAVFAVLIVLVGACTAPEPADETLPDGRPGRSETGESSVTVVEELHPSRVPNRQIAGQWTLLGAVIGNVGYEPSSMWRPSLGIAPVGGWKGNDGCNGFGFSPPGTKPAGYHNQKECEQGIMPQSGILFAALTAAESAVLTDGRLVISGPSATLTYTRAAEVALSPEVLAQSLLLPSNAIERLQRDAGLPSFGLVGSDASCPEIWNSSWPGDTPIQARQIYETFILPSMIFSERVVVFDTPEQASTRAGTVFEVLATCRQNRDDVFNEYDPDINAELVAAFQLTRTHMFDPFGTATPTPMQRTTNFLIATTGPAVITFVGIQAGKDPPDHTFLKFVDRAIGRANRILTRQTDLNNQPSQ